MSEHAQPEQTGTYDPGQCPQVNGPTAEGSVLKDLGESLPDVPRVHLREPITEDLTPVNLPGSPARPETSVSPDNHAQLLFLHEIARGGMGAIFRGRDVDLGRDIAVKVLLETHAARSDFAQRFIEEAQIAGQLQHPGVAPVYKLGVLADRRPYFTMKLVKGQTLAAQLAARKDVTEDRPKFLGIFAQVCQTLAYAHARGVIHRDLKPSNIMVGAFGEVQVMDWGLAKVLYEGGVADEKKARQRQEVSIIRTQRSQGTSEPEAGSYTQVGSILGTPAYMAPEQARGEVELIDERADVFGLGAILCEILTDRPPFTGKGGEAQRKAQTGRLDEAFARLEGCGADAELIALARRCLAAEPWDRPRHAGQVADEVTAYQHAVAERLHLAELERAAAEAQAVEEAQTRRMAEGKAREERKRRRAMLALAATVLALWIIGGGAAAWWWQERTAIAGDVEAALASATEHGRAGRWPEARAALERAEGRLGGIAPTSLRDKVRQARADADMVAELEEIRLSLSESKGLDFDYAGLAARYAATFRAYGIDVAELSAEEAVARVRDSGIREPLLAALDDWLRHRPQSDGDEFLAVVQEAVARVLGWGIREPLLAALDDWLRHRPRSDRDKLLAVVQAADDNAWRRSFRTALSALDFTRIKELAGQKEASDQPAALLDWLGEGLRQAGITKQAAAVLRQAQRRYPADFWINYDLAYLLSFELVPRRHEEALSYGRVAVAIRPGSATAHNILGAILTNTGDWEGGIAEYRQALTLNPNDPWTHNNLGLALTHEKDWDGALGELRQANLLRPKDVQIQSGIGFVLQRKGEREEALLAFRKAIALDPTYALAHANVGDILADKNDLEGAIAEYRQALKLDPKLAVTQHDLGGVLLRKNDLDGAIRAYRQATALDPRSAHTYVDLGYALLTKKEWNEAVAALNRAVALNPRNSAAHYYLGAALHNKKDLDGAIAEYRQAVTLDPTGIAGHRGLGSAHEERREWDEAGTAFRQALKLDPKDAGAAHGLSRVLLKRGRPEEALAPWRKALEGNPPDHDSWYGYAELCLFLGQEGEYRRARKALLDRFGKTTDPTIAERTGRACLLLPATGDELRQAIALADRAVAAGPKHPYYVFFAVAEGLAEYRRDHLDGTIDWLRKAIAGRAFMPARLVLAMAQYRRGQIEEARQTLAEAIRSYDWNKAPVDSHDVWICHVLRREAETLIVPNLGAFLRGEYQPEDNAERLELSLLCRFQLRPLASARLCVEAFAADPKLADDLNAQHRYNAACHATRAGSGQGKDAAKLNDKERGGWRKQALEWLRADLAAIAKRLDSGKPEDWRFVQERLQHWQRDSDLSGIRDKDLVARLPNEEREACKKMWTDVDTLLRTAQEKSK